MTKRDYIEIAAFESFPEKLANTYDVALAEPERLATVSDLKHFLEESGIPVLHPLSNDDLTEVQAVRESIRTVFSAPSDEDGIQCLNQLLTGVGAEPRLQEASGKLNLRYDLFVSDKIAENVRSVAALSLAQVVDRLGFDRLRACEADPCRDMFVDTSKKGARRFCSPRCASRVHVSEFRKRSKISGIQA